MVTLDYLVFAAYLIAILLIGIIASRRKQTSDEYHIAGRTMKWFPIGLSIVATAFSAVNFTQFSGEVFRHGMYVTMAIPMFLVIIYPIMHYVIPFFNERKPISAYEILETRFSRSVRQMTSMLFIIWRICWMSLILYATALFLNRIVDIDTTTLIFITGAITTAYTFTGGMRSVIWTDVAQFAVLFGSLLVGVCIACVDAGGLGTMFRIGTDNGLLKPFHPFDPSIFSLDPSIRISFWSCLIGASVIFIARYGSDQMVVQRYFTARDISDAKKGFLLNIVLSVLTLLCLAFIGIAVFAQSRSTQMPHGLMAEEYLALFVKSLPPGICGLLVSGLCASTMSSIDSGIHSCCTSLIMDFHKKDRSVSVRLDRYYALFIGIISSVFACHVGKLGSIFEIANKIVNGLGSPILAVFLVGWKSRYVTAKGVFIGGLAGILFSILGGIYIQKIALHYYAVINLLATIAFCYLFSMIDKAFRK